MKFKKIFGMVGVLLTISLCTSCSGGDTYSSYNSAYKKTSSTGSLDINFDLKLNINDNEKNMESSGNMKTDGQNLVFDITLNNKKITQYLKDGKMHTLVDGNEQVTAIDKKEESTKADIYGGEGQGNEKTDETAFDSEKFLEEFSGILEAGKIKEMGLLDPIPSKYIKDIKRESSDDGYKYTMTFPDEFADRLLNVMIEEQVGKSEESISFGKLKNFECVVTENKDGYMSGMAYKGSTDVTVPAKYMSSGQDETFNLNIDLEINIQNPGAAVTVTIPE